ncbi:hypothetical protein, partial [Bradyrhizobium elkanii]
MGEDKEKIDPNQLLAGQLLDVATKVYTARAGEVIGNRHYDQHDAARDAAILMTVTLTPVNAKAIFDQAA